MKQTGGIAPQPFRRIGRSTGLCDGTGADEHQSALALPASDEVIDGQEAGDRY
jgi:hypothetical protein